MSRSNLIFLAACGAVWLLLYQMIAVQNRALVVEDHRQAGRAPLLRIRPAGRVAQISARQGTADPWAFCQQVGHEANGRRTRTMGQ